MAKLFSPRYLQSLKTIHKSFNIKYSRYSNSCTLLPISRALTNLNEDSRNNRINRTVLSYNVGTNSLFKNNFSTSEWCLNLNKKPDTNETQSESDPPQPPKKLGLVARFKDLTRKYWYVLVPVHVITSAGWLAGFYYLSTSGVDMVALMQAMSINERIIDNLKDSSMGHYAITYMCYKIFTPLRYTVTIGGTTLSIKYLSQWGYIKPMPTKDEFQKMYDDKKAQMKQSYDDKKAQMKQEFDDKKAQVMQGFDRKPQLKHDFDEKKTKMTDSYENLHSKNKLKK